MKAHLKLAEKIYGKLNHSSGFKDFKNQRVLGTDFLLPIHAALGYKKLFALYTEKTGSTIVSNIGAIMNCSNPGASVLNQRYYVMPDHYLLTVTKEMNKYERRQSTDHMPRNGVFNLFEYMVFDMVHFLETKRHLDEVEYFTSSAKNHEPHTVCLATIFINASHHCYPKVFHHNRQLVIDLHSVKTATPTYHRIFKTPVVTPLGDDPEIA